MVINFGKYSIRYSLAMDGWMVLDLQHRSANVHSTRKGIARSNNILGGRGRKGNGRANGKGVGRKDALRLWSGVCIVFTYWVYRTLSTAHSLLSVLSTNGRVPLL
jgi:hypothetical protein